jgi:anti-anti-sigma factor
MSLRRCCEKNRGLFFSLLLMKGNRMESFDNNKLCINVTALSNTATIYLSGYFSFDAHRAFKAAYINHLEDAKIGNIVINLSGVKYLDSSALGMLLLLRDHVMAASKSLILSSPSSIAARTFDMAGFHKMFTIN